MIKQGILNGELGVDSHIHRDNGSCPLMPEEVCSGLRFNFQVQTVQCMLTFYLDWNLVICTLSALPRI